MRLGMRERVLRREDGRFKGFEKVGGRKEGIYYFVVDGRRG